MSARILQELQHAERKLERTLDQSMLLRNQLNELAVRFRRARGNGRHGHVYTLRYRLCTVRYLWDMFAEYGKRLVDNIADLQRQLGRMRAIENTAEAPVVISDDDDDDNAPASDDNALVSVQHVNQDGSSVTVSFE